MLIEDDSYTMEPVLAELPRGFDENTVLCHSKLQQETIIFAFMQEGTFEPEE